MARHVADLSDLLSQRVLAGFVGRTDELALLDRLLQESGAAVVLHVQGIAGIGKSTLLTHFAIVQRTQGVPVVAVDCRAVEPTKPAFLHELGRVLGLEQPTLEAIAEHLHALGDRAVVTLDHYEVFRLLDTWLRQVFLPRLPSNVRIVLSGREPPTAAWLTALEWKGLFRHVVLGPLREEDALALLARDGIESPRARRINHIVRGHPLALTLAARAASDRQHLDINSIADQAIVDALARRYLAEIRDPLTRRSLEASSVIRRTTRSLIQAMLPEDDSAAALECLRDLPFVESDRDGLVVHEAVREGMVTGLRAADPRTHREYRRAAWRQLRAELRDAGRGDLWRYTADMLYLIENPVVREAFFPSDTQHIRIVPAQASDEPAILAIARQHAGTAECSHFAMWWAEAPQSFSVARDPSGIVVGFYCLLQPATVSPALLRRDPVTAAWSDHLRRDSIPESQRTLFVRRWLSRDCGEQPSPVQAACWLDVQRTYLEMRPELRRIYTTARDLPTYAPVVTRLGFRLLPDSGVELDGEKFHSVMLDFGPASVDGWLASLAAAELGVDVESDGLLDVTAHELVIDGNHVHLTRLEFDLIHYLQLHQGEVVSRDILLDKVWRHNYEGGSNVVDVTVLALRKKMGRRAASLETVRGVGYRLTSA